MLHSFTRLTKAGNANANTHRLHQFWTNTTCGMCAPESNRARRPSSQNTVSRYQNAVHGFPHSYWKGNVETTDPVDTNTTTVQNPGLKDIKTSSPHYRSLWFCHWSFWALISQTKCTSLGIQDVAHLGRGRERQTAQGKNTTNKTFSQFVHQRQVYFHCKLPTEFNPWSQFINRLIERIHLSRALMLINTNISFKHNSTKLRHTQPELLPSWEQLTTGPGSLSPALYH